MSRRCLISKNQDRSVTVGWDPPLATYFVQVERLDRDDDAMVLWLGNTQAEIPTLEQLERILGRHARFEDVDRVQLLADRVVNDGLPGAQEEADRLAAETVTSCGKDLKKALVVLGAMEPRPRLGAHPALAKLQAELAALSQK